MLACHAWLNTHVEFITRFTLFYSFYSYLLVIFNISFVVVVRDAGWYYTGGVCNFYKKLKRKTKKNEKTITNSSNNNKP